MDITERYTTQDGRQFLIRLSYNERIKDADPNTAFIRSLDVTDRETNTPVTVPANASKFSTYENFTTSAATRRSTTSAPAKPRLRACGKSSDARRRLL